MASFLLLLICLALGVLLRRFANPPEGLAKSLNWWVLHVALSAMVLEMIPRLRFDTSLWFLVVALWLIFLSSWLLFHCIGTRLSWPRATIGAVVLAGGLCNTSFVGLPLIEALLGKQALTYAALGDQLGSFMNVSIGGPLVLAMYSGVGGGGRLMLRKILLFPPFIALLVAGLVALTPGWPALLDTVLARISATMAPLALFAVGLQLRIKPSPGHLPPLLLGLTFKLAIAPLAIFGLGTALNISHPIFSVTLLDAAMAPMITAAILAEQGNLDPPLANMLVGLGILISFITVPLWNLLL